PVRALLRLGRTDMELDTPGEERSPARTYVLFIGLTLLNPATVAYFVTLAVGLPQIAQDAGSRVAFAVGASLSSLSWQTLLAAIGAALHTRLTPRIELATALLSSAILVGFALRIAADETDQRSEDARTQRRGVVAEETLSAREKDHDHEGDQQRERALIEPGEQESSDRRADRRRDEKLTDPTKQVALAKALDQEKGVRGEDRDGDDRNGESRAE